MKIPVFYILSNIDKALAFEWIAEKLDKEKYALSFILLNPGQSVLESFLKEKEIPVYPILYRGKRDMFRAFFKIRKILKKNKAHIVHTHLFDASLIGQLAAKSLGIKKRIYTRHHGSQHHDYFPRAVYYDRFINTLAKKIIAPSQNVKDILVQREYVPESKIEVIYHGFQLKDFELADAEKVKKLQIKYQSKGYYPVIGLISRYTHLKGIQYVIPAFQDLLQRYPKALLLLANAGGDYKNEIQKLLKDMLPADAYREIVFEADIVSLYQLFDIFVNTTISRESESFGQTYIEALAAGIPSVFTLSGVAAEFIEHEKNALVVPYKDSQAIFEAMNQILSDKALKDNIIAQGKTDVKELFTLQKMISSLEKIYAENS